MTATAKAKREKRIPNPGGQAGQQPHQPTAQSIASVRAMAGVGYNQETIARHIGVSPPTLRVHYRELLDTACESTCAAVFANLVRTATTKNDAAGVLAAKFILSCRAPGWVERSKLEVDEIGPGLGGLLTFVEKARARRAQSEEARIADEAEDAHYIQHMPNPASRAN